MATVVQESQLQLQVRPKHCLRVSQKMSLKNYRKEDTLKEPVDSLKEMCNNFTSNCEFMVSSFAIQLSKLHIHKVLQVQYDIQSLLIRASLSEPLS